MSRRLLVVPAHPGAGSSTVVLGLVHALDADGVDVGFAKPLAQPRRGEGQLLWQLPDPVQTKAEADSQTNSSRTKHPRHLVSGHRRMHPRGSSRA